MKELLEQIAKGLVDEPDSVSGTVDETDDRGVTVYHLHVAENDMGLSLIHIFARTGSKTHPASFLLIP